MGKLLVLFLVLASIFLFAGCDLPEPWNEISKIAQTGKYENDIWYKDVEFEDGSYFYFAYAKSDNSLAIAFAPNENTPLVGVTLVLDKKNKCVKAAVVLFTPFGIRGKAVELKEAREAAKLLLDEFHKRQGKIKEKVEGVVS